MSATRQEIAPGGGEPTVGGAAAHPVLPTAELSLGTGLKPARRFRLPPGQALNSQVTQKQK